MRLTLEEKKKKEGLVYTIIQARLLFASKTVPSVHRNNGLRRRLILIR